MTELAATDARALSRRSEAWTRTDRGEPRGYIEPATLRELWFHTGTTCNLSCPFCLEGSKPGDDRLNRIGFEDARPFIDEALALGVEQFSFTGGEPFVVRDVIRILAYALDRRPCLVLTNGTAPLLKRMADIEPLLEKPHALSLRVSVDYPDAARHDAGRGAGNYRLAMRTVAMLAARSVHVSVARQADREEDREAVEEAYRAQFRSYGIREDTPLVAFPDFGPPGSHREVPQITENCMTTYQDAESRARFMCAFSKMVVKRDGRMRVIACTLVDDDPDYDLGGTLAESMQVRVMLKHHRCYACFAYGASCSECG